MKFILDGAVRMTPRANDTEQTRIARLVLASILTDGRDNTQADPRGYWALGGTYGSKLWSLTDRLTGSQADKVQTVQGTLAAALAWLQTAGIASVAVTVCPLQDGYAAQLAVTPTKGGAPFNIAGTVV